MDAILHVDEQVHIIDYKTNARFDMKESIKLQLAIYSLLYSELYGKMPDKVGIFFLRHKLKMMKVDEDLLKLAKQEIELDLHPDNKKKGRKFKVNDEFYLCKEDYDKIKDNESVRLMDCLSFTKQKDLVFDSLEYDKDKTKKIIHWLPKEGNVDVEVLMPDKKLVNGVGEKGLGKLKEGDIVQLQRFGFCRLDKKEKDKLVFWYCHK